MVGAALSLLTVAMQIGDRKAIEAKQAYKGQGEVGHREVV